MSDLPACPECGSAFTYEDRELYVCPECAHEWASESTQDASVESAENGSSISDANGNLLVDGDTVTVIKDLKVKGSSSVVKVGTKVKNIRLVEGDHDIDCKIDGIGAMKLKSQFVKKS
jgi:protein PhnA